MFLQTVGGIGNAGVGVRANDGAQIRCLDDGVTLTGTLGDMKAGTKPVRAWGTAIATPPGNFYFDAPQKNELDLVSPPVGDETTGAGTGGTSLSRIFARPF
jgi:hypothetical protein